MFRKHLSKLKRICLLTVVSGTLTLFSASVVIGDFPLTAPFSFPEEMQDQPTGGQVIVNQFSSQSDPHPTNENELELSSPKRLIGVSEESSPHGNESALEVNEPVLEGNALILGPAEAPTDRIQRQPEATTTSIATLPTFITMIVAPKSPSATSAEGETAPHPGLSDPPLDEETSLDTQTYSSELDSYESPYDGVDNELDQDDDNTIVENQQDEDFDTDEAWNLDSQVPLTASSQRLDSSSADTDDSTEGEAAVDIDDPSSAFVGGTEPADDTELLPEPSLDSDASQQPAPRQKNDASGEALGDERNSSVNVDAPRSDDHPSRDLPVDAYTPTTLYDDESLEACGCDPVWFENCCAPWIAQFDMLVLFRQGGDTATPVLNCDCDVTVIRPRAFDNWDTGVRGRLKRDNIIGNWGLETVYWQMDEWQDRFSFSGIGHTLVGVNIGSGNSSISYQSELNTFELNATKYLTNWTQIGIGFRWLNLDEVATARGNGSLVANLNRRAVTNNDLYGGQIVMNHTFWDRGGDLIVSARAAAGVYQNQIDRITFGYGTSPLNDEQTAFVGEGELTAQYFLTDNFSVQMGYQCMWLTNVALAIDQFFDAGSIRSNSDLFLNGLTFGLGYEW